MFPVVERDQHGRRRRVVVHDHNGSLGEGRVEDLDALPPPPRRPRPVGAHVGGVIRRRVLEGDEDRRPLILSRTPRFLEVRQGIYG